VARASGGINRTGSVPFLELFVPRSARRGVQINGAVSTDLHSWNRGAPHCLIVENEADHLLFRSTTPVTDAQRQFIRAEVEKP
jgi:hypothetical protein